MQSFEFTINEVSVGPGEHSWVAIQDETQTKIPLPKGGNTIGEKSYVDGVRSPDGPKVTLSPH